MDTTTGQAAAPGTAPAPTNDVVLATQVLQALRHRLWIVVLCGALGAGVAWSGATYEEHFYTADGSVAIETQRFAIPELQGALSGETSWDAMALVRVEAQVLGSRQLVDRVIDELDLASLPEFNEELQEANGFDRLVQDLRDRFGRLMGEEAEPETPPSAETIRWRVSRAVMRRLGISQDNRSYIISVYFTATDPNVAAAVVNTLIRRYVESRSEARAAANRDANTQLVARTQEVRAELEGIEQRLRDLRVRNQLVNLRSGSVGQQQLEELGAALTRASVERTQAEAGAQRVASLGRGGNLDQLGDVMAAQTIQRLRERESDAARRVAELAARFGANHPDRRSAESELAAVRGQLVTEIRRVTGSLNQQLESAREREASLGRQLEEARRGATELVAVQAEIAELEKEAEARRALSNQLAERAEQTSAASTGNQQVPGARIVNAAVVPRAANGPKPDTAGVLGTISGLLFGGLIAVYRGWGSAFAGPRDVTELTGLATFASVPRLRGRRRRWLGAHVLEAPASPQADALRTLRARLRFARPEGPPRSVVFVSSFAGEGATSIAAAFARVAAAGGERVLLVEGDLQKATLAQRFGLEIGTGLAEVLQEQVMWRDAVVRDRATGLDLLLAGRPQRDAHGMVVGTRFENLLASAGEEYELIVLDSPPAAAVSDAMPLAYWADAAVLVVSAGRTRRLQVREAARRLIGAARSRPVAILNRTA